jgi:biopolymer transport protein ExbB
LQSFVTDAGWPIWPLLALSVAGLAIIIERFLSLQTRRIAPPELSAQVLQMVRAGAASPEALDKLQASSPLGQILAQLVRKRHLPEAELRLAVEDSGREVAHSLQRYLPALGTVATIAPLMGLFGTVVGMIEIFAAYRPDGSDPTQLARGISVALYNTGFGIMIAVPAMIAHRHFKSRVEGLLLRMEQSARRLNDALKG